MISFIVCILLLIAGYVFYGKYIDRVFGSDDRITPAYSVNDGVDFVPMPLWKVYLIQLLNIAGTGPVFGALSGALFGPVAYLWIVFGCVFCGAAHDFLCGMVSLRHRGASISEITGIYLGNAAKQVMRVFSVVLLVMCAVVFTTGPAELLGILCNGRISVRLWLWIITAYYFVATFVPVDKVIGRLYPLFGICLILMALGVSASLLFSGRFSMPELFTSFTNTHPEKIPVWPFMFITIACGAVSGFHATQSPMMARCIKSEKQGRKVFYGAMISEGIIALVWVAAGVSCYETSRQLLEAGGGCSAVVYHICSTTMGKAGSILAMLGVIVCPISSGDTAYRSARLTLADWFKADQSDWKKRLLLTLPLLIAGSLICGIDYSTVWRYFSFANQMLAAISLWAFAVYLKKEKKNYRIAELPAFFMSAVTLTYFFAAPECLGFLRSALDISQSVYYPLSAGAGALCAIAFAMVFRRFCKRVTP